MVAGTRLGRYVLHSKIASGGMATVYLGRMKGPVGFSRVVAIKRMHRHLAEDQQFVAMFLDEAALAARIQHPNVVATVDLVAEEGELFLVMEYIRGESLSSLIHRASKVGEKIPIPVAVSVAAGALSGLHAAHEAKSETGEPLGLVHRDISPQNVLVGIDGTARIVDFGIAKAASRLQVTHTNQLKGKTCYMAPEQIDPRKRPTMDRGVDIFAAGVVLWELLTSERLFDSEEPLIAMQQVAAGLIPPVRSVRPEVSAALEAVVSRALERDRTKRFATAEDFAGALESATARIATPRAVGEWVRQLMADRLAEREARVKEMETSPDESGPPLVATPVRMSFPSIGATGSRVVPPAPPSAPSAASAPAGTEEPTAPETPFVPPSQRTMQIDIPGGMPSDWTPPPTGPSFGAAPAAAPAPPPSAPFAAAPAPGPFAPIPAQAGPPLAPPQALQEPAPVLTPARALFLADHGRTGTTDPNQMGPVTGAGGVTTPTLFPRGRSFLRLYVAAGVSALAVFLVAAILLSRRGPNTPSEAAARPSAPEPRSTATNTPDTSHTKPSPPPTEEPSAPEPSDEPLAARSAATSATPKTSPTPATASTTPNPTGSQKKPPPRWVPARP